MNLEFFFGALTTVWVVWEILLLAYTQTRPGEGKIQDRGSQIILWVVFAGSLKLNDWMHSLFPVDMPGSYSWLRPTALGVLILGLAVRVLATVMLGSAFSTNVATRDGQRLQRRGLYSVVRHPSYLGLRADSPGVGASRMHMGLFCRCPGSTDPGCVVSHAC